MDRVAAARAYYDALDGHDYDALSELLAADFAHDRPDRTIEGRDAFVQFMREGRPNPETTHALDAVAAGDGEVFARGRLLDGGPASDASGASSDERSESDGDDVLVRFCDAFAFDDGRVARVTTYTT